MQRITSGFWLIPVCMLAVWLLTGGCRKKADEVVANQAPITFLEVDTIIRSGANRLTSSVRLRWGGSDADGFVVGYQVVWGHEPVKQEDWLTAPLVTTTDSTFLFGFPEGSTDTTDIFFAIRAVDNRQTPDPSPASLLIPIKNNPPTIDILNTTFPASDTILPVFSLRFSVDDPDGLANVKTVLFRANDGLWVELPRNARFLTMVPMFEGGVATGDAWIFMGENLALAAQRPNPFNATLTSYNPGTNNTFSFKVFDQAGDSAIASSPRWFMRTKTSDLLVLDAYRANVAPSPESVYYPIFQDINSGFDVLNYAAPYRTSNLQFFNTTFYLYLSLYSKVFWYGDNPSALEETITSFEQYLRFGGKAMFVSTFPATPRLEEDSPVFPFFGLDGIAPSPASLLRTAVIDSIDPNYRTMGLLSDNFITGVYFLFPRVDADTILRVPASSLRSAPVYTGRRIAATRRKNQTNNRTNLIFSCLELHRFTARPGMLEQNLNYIFNEEFNW